MGYRTEEGWGGVGEEGKCTDTGTLLILIHRRHDKAHAKHLCFSLSVWELTPDVLQFHTKAT